MITLFLYGFVEQAHGLFDQILRVDVGIEENHLRGDVQINADVVAGRCGAVGFWRTLTGPWRRRHRRRRRRFATTTTVLDRVYVLDQRVEARQTVELLEDQIECSMQIRHLTVGDLKLIDNLRLIQNNNKKFVCYLL